LLVLLLTTWFEFADNMVRTSVIGRLCEFRVGETTLRVNPPALGFLGESTAV